MTDDNGSKNPFEELSEIFEGSDEEKLEEIESPEKLGAKILGKATELWGMVKGLGENFIERFSKPKDTEFAEKLGGLDEQAKEASEALKNKMEVYIEGEGWVGAFDEFDPTTKKAWEGFESFEKAGIFEPFSENEYDTLHGFEDTLRNNGRFEELEKLLNSKVERDGGASAKDTWKLLLRVGIRVSAKMAVIIARNIAKDKETSRETKIMLGIFADTVDQTSGFADKLIAGDVEADLQKDVIEAITGNKQEKE